MSKYLHEKKTINIGTEEFLVEYTNRINIIVDLVSLHLFFYRLPHYYYHCYSKKPINIKDWIQNWSFPSYSLCFSLLLCVCCVCVRLISLAFLVLWFCKIYCPAAQKELDIPKYKMNNMCNFVFCSFVGGGGVSTVI